MAAGSPPAYGSPPAASADLGDLMSASSPSPVGTGGGLNIVAPGASPAQLQQWFLRLTVNKEVGCPHGSLEKHILGLKWELSSLPSTRECKVDVGREFAATEFA